MKSATLFSAVTLSFCMALDAQAGKFFLDDFDVDGEFVQFTDEPTKDVHWGTGGYGAKNRGGGNLVLTVLPGSPYAWAFAPVDPYQDISLRTQFRMGSTSVTNAGAIARMDGVTFYYASIEPAGRLQLYQVIDGDPGLLSETVLPDIDATTADVNMQFDLAGDLLSVTAWADGSPRPDTAQLSIEDSVIVGGAKVGVWMRGGTGTSTTYRYFAAIPEPSAAILLLVGLAASAVIRL